MARLSPEYWSRVGTYCALFALLGIVAANYLALDFSFAGLALALAGMAGAAALQAGWEEKSGIRPGSGIIGMWAVFGCTLWLLGRSGLVFLSPGQAVYLALAGWVLSRGWYLLRQGLLPVAGPSVGENLRLIAFPVLAVWLFRPFLSPDFFGGLDARSYGYGMADVLQQARAGVFPVLVGQSEFMFNGAIHPIRTAPYHHSLGILIDVLTTRALTPLAVQHLTVLVTAIQAGLTGYACLTFLAPTRRWLAWVMAILYLSAPAMAHYIYPAEMHMTFMAFAYLPLVFFGVVWIVRHDTFTGWACLAGGLAMVWFCHAPVAAWLTVGVGLIHGLRLLTRDANPGAWRHAAGGGLLFLGLTAGYFWSITEIFVAREDDSVRAVYFVGFVAGLAGMIRYLATGRWIWLGGVVLAMGALWSTERVFSLWLSASAGLSLALTISGQHRPGLRWRERLPEYAVLVVLVGGVCVLPWMPKGDAMPSFGWVSQVFPKILLPVSERAALLTDMQIGYPLWTALLAGVTAAIFIPSWENRFLALLGLLWVALVLPVPGITRLLLNAIPKPLATISSDILWIRYLPTMVGLSVFAGFLGFDRWLSRFPGSRPFFTLMACGALAWSLYESEKFVRCGYRSTTTSGTTRAFYRPENVRQFAYIFAGVPVSPYLTNGVVDYHLESRLLRAEDPTQEIADLTAWSHASRFTLTAVSDEHSPHWLRLSPGLVLAPDERVLLRFEFLDRTYQGTLILQGPRGFYREYQLPAAGFFPKSFGVGSERPKTLALWNTEREPQPVEFVFIRTDAPDAKTPFGDFARIEILPYHPASLPVKTRRLVPTYRAETQTDQAVFLETPRTYIPGYRATVNGAPTAVARSPHDMVMVALPPGPQTVDLRYVGTAGFWVALAVSASTWVGMITFLFVRRSRVRTLG